jgi:DNA-binding transcriptional ArsR family regulator
MLNYQVSALLVRRNIWRLISQMNVITVLKKTRPAQPPGDQILTEQAADVARVMNLLGNENRLLILCYLMMHKEMKVGDIVDAVKLSQSALSQHLTKLREEGLVEFRRESQTLYYRIADPRVSKLIKVLKKLYCEDVA